MCLEDPGETVDMRIHLGWLLFSKTFAEKAVTDDKLKDVDVVFLPKTTSTTTTPFPSSPEYLTSAHREGLVKWHPGLHNTLVEDGWRYRSACQACDPVQIQEYTQSKVDAAETHTVYWGFEVNREFGEVNCRSCTCVHYIAQRWDKWREYRDKYPQVHKFDVQDIPERCSKSLDILHDNHKDFELDHRGEGGENALEIAILGDNLKLAEKLVKLGEHLAPRTNTGDTCSLICMEGLAPSKETRLEIGRFEKEKRNSTNHVDYDRASLHLKKAQKQLKWCNFIHDNHLRCSNYEVTKVMPHLSADAPYPSQERWAAAKIRSMFQANSMPRDEEILDVKNFVPWDVTDHPVLAGDGEDDDDDEHTKSDDDSDD